MEKKEDKEKIEGEKELEELKKKLEEYQKQKEEYLAGWQRERADFLNYKKEEMERIKGFLAYASEEFVSKILPILDNFEVVEKKLPEDSKKDESVKGVLQIKKQIIEFLRSQGVEEIKAMGEMFNPEFHEVTEEVEPSVAKAMEGKEIKSGEIIEEIQKGYKINGELLRPAKVKVVK
jgi:molecular chaperone GrpE